MKKYGIVPSLMVGLVLGLAGAAGAEPRKDLVQPSRIAFSSPSFGLGQSAPQKRLDITAPPTSVIEVQAKKKKKKKPPVRTSVAIRPLNVANGAAWMHSDVQAAWAQGYTGRGATITVVDGFSAIYNLRGNMSGKSQVLAHGGWTSTQAGMVAPSARIVTKDFNTGRTAVRLQSGFNVMNLSYGVYFAAGTGAVNWAAQERSLINFANAGSAVVVKAAGNDGVAVGANTRAGRIDLLARDLIGADAAIFVGALSDHGSAERPARLASYSNVAGPNDFVQDQFLVVGVKSSVTGLAGTSFAAPIVAGYAAIVQQKFAGATPAAVANQLLTTARQDTILGYNPAVHGRGEASLSRALAPAAIR